MDGSDYLLTCAEIGVALAGFAALVVAFRQGGSDPVTPAHRRLVAILIERGLAATFLSLLPILLAGLTIPTRAVWFVSSLALSSYASSMAWRSLMARNTGVLPDFVAPVAFRLLMLVGISVAVLELIHALGFWMTQSVWWYVVGITWLLASAAYMFLFVVRDWMRAG